MGYLMWVTPGRFPLEVQQGRDPMVGPKLTERYLLFGLGMSFGSPWGGWKVLLGGGMSKIPCLPCCHRDSI